MTVQQTAESELSCIAGIVLDCSVSKMEGKKITLIVVHLKMVYFKFSERRSSRKPVKSKKRDSWDYSVAPQKGNKLSRWSKNNGK